MIVHEQRYESTGEVRLLFWCPGCGYLHGIRTAPSSAVPNGDVWSYNGNAEKPTFSPSILTDGSTPDRRCHSFVREGMIQYLDDCHHQLKGTTVPMVPIPFTI